MKNSKTSGISLVALVVTIIVLIILTGAVIVTFMDGGIIDRANEAVFKSDIRTYQQQLVTIRADHQIAIYTKDTSYNGPKVIDEIITDENKIKEILPEFNYKKYGSLVKIDDGKLVAAKELSEDVKEEKWLLELGFGAVEGGNSESKELTIGTYVNYVPTETEKEVFHMYDGPYTYKTQTDLKWRYIGQNSEGRMMLISATPTTDGITPHAAGGWGESASGVCSVIYSSEVADATNINLSHIEMLTGTTIDTNNIVGKKTNEIVQDSELHEIIFGTSNYFAIDSIAFDTRNLFECSLCGEETEGEEGYLEVSSDGKFNLCSRMATCLNCGPMHTPTEGGVTGPGFRPIITLKEGYTIKQVSGQWTVVAE